MQVNGVAQIEARQNGEDIGLQRGDQEFEEDQQDVDAQRHHVMNELAELFHRGTGRSIDRAGKESRIERHA